MINVKNLKGKNALVTGASGGMGLLLCDMMAKAGMNLALCSVDKSGLEAQAKALTDKYDINLVSDVVDTTNENSVAGFVEKAANTLGKLDFLVNLAGLSIPNKYNETDVSVYEKVMDVNIKGSFLTSKHFAEVAANSALIINIGSMAARKTNANAPIYCMAKAAVNKLSEGLLLQYGQRNIRVTTINPGGADTPFWGTRTVDKSKLMQADDVVSVIWFVLNLNDTIQMHSIDFESFARFN